MADKTSEQITMLSAENVCFEDALGKLELIVNDLENGELSLEKALVKFEEGIRYSRYCMQRLQEIETKIDLLLSEEEGQPAFRPVSLEGEKEC